MTAVSGVSASDTNQAVSPQSSNTSTTATGESSAFARILEGILHPDAAGNVSEEALFAALTLERVKSMKGEEAGARYEALLKKTEGEMTTANGYIPYEDAARSALDLFRQAGELTGEEADTIHSQAFGAAQLDSNTAALFDHLGSTLAVSQMSAALASAQTLIDKYVAGTETATSRPIAEGLNTSGIYLNPYEAVSVEKAAAVSVASGDSGDSGVSAEAVETNIPSTGTFYDGAGGFLFKPRSASDGKLAIVLPMEVSEFAVDCLLKDSSGKVVETGSYVSPTKPEGDSAQTRKKYSFTKAGGEYPDNLTVEVKLTDGSTISYEIADPSKRYD